MNTILTDSQIASIAPSVFATQPHHSRSDRYAHIPTSRVLEGLRANGFAPVKVQVARVRLSDRAGFEKHMIRFRQTDTAIARAVGDIFPEVVLTNSHDGSSVYNLMAGLFRLVCLNGMVVAEGPNNGSIRVRHSGKNIVDEVVDGSFRVIEQAQKSIEAANRWSQIQLSAPEQMALAVSAHQVRFGNAEGIIDTPIQPMQLLTPRRFEDQKNDLWTTFNRIQENSVKGGLHAVARRPDGRRRRVSSREVKGIDGNVNLNRALWQLAEFMANAKTASN
jgi:hypothetical protein